MAKIQTYYDMKVKTKWATPDPGIEIREALTNTMADLSKFETKWGQKGKVSSDLLYFLFRAEHSSVVEHAVISFMITGVSRAFLAQITRHRIGSFTSSSQHYQNYADYAMIIGEELNNLEIKEKVFNKAISNYLYLVEKGVPIEEARQVLPNACAVNLKWTVNARSLWNFIRQRTCYRNVKEMRIFSSKILTEVINWWPEFYYVLGPPCYIDGKCNQGKMSCGKTWERNVI